MTRAVQAGVTWAPMPEEMERGRDAAVEQATNKFAAWLQLLLEALKRDEEVPHTVHTMAGGAAEHAIVVHNTHQPA